MKVSTLLVVMAAVLAASSCRVPAQVNASVPAMSMETTPELIASLTPEQKAQYEAAGRAFNAHQYAEALAGFQAMLRDLPGEPILSKFASEAALQMGDPKVAISALVPIVQANPADWQAVPLLTRAYAEAGDKVHRDEGMAQMMALRQHGGTPQNLQQYTVERVKAGDKDVTILAYLVPWGGYKVYDMARVADAKGTIFLRISLESGDGDQALFAKEHPADAAAGKRLFSMDAYQETGLNAAGQRTQTHYTYAFFAGQPSYDTIREKFLEIVNGKVKPISSRTGLIVQ